MNADQQIQELSKALCLTYARQDWGITNADPSRVREFMLFCRATTLTLVQQYAMVELVFASTNDAIAEGMADEELVNDFSRFLTSGLHGLPSQIKYWSSLSDPVEFPITRLLHQLTRVA